MSLLSGTKSDPSIIYPQFPYKGPALGVTSLARLETMRATLGYFKVLTKDTRLL